MARDSLPEWQALSAASGLPIFHPCGILFFFASEEPYVRDTIATHKETGLATEVLFSTDMRQRFPAIDFDGIEIGIHEPAFGVLMARRAVQTLVDQFVRAGGKYVRDAVRVPQGSELREIQLASGGAVAADRFVFALGPWLPKLFPEVIGPRIRVTRQEIFYFEAPSGDGRFLPGALPGWVDFNGGDMFYGMPDLEGRGVKFAYDIHGPEADPDTQDRRASDAGQADVVAYRDRRCPALRGAPMIGGEVCQYENSSNGDFLIDFHPRWENVLLVGGGSGHGFKHGPEVGRYAAARLFGSVEPEPRFSLASKSKTHRREVH
jgi:glycine/D-amino acid oxidase-like deaminating enzyme